MFILLIMEIVSRFLQDGLRSRFHRKLELPVVVFKTVNEIRTRPDGSLTRWLKLTARRKQKPRPPLPCRLLRYVYFSHTVIYNVTVCINGDKIVL